MYFSIVPLTKLANAIASPRNCLIIFTIGELLILIINE